MIEQKKNNKQNELTIESKELKITKKQLDNEERKELHCYHVEIGLMACNRFMKRIKEKINFIEFRKNEEGTFYSILRSL